MVLALIILAIVIGFLLIERQIVNSSVSKLELRVHINGTRGKSSVTKYIASGLSLYDDSLMAKITGVHPTIISSRFNQVLGRKGVARVQEQFSVIRLAARKDIRKLVLECMSITPELQQLESKLFKPHIYVITNIKDDHREVMGFSLREQAEAICNAIPFDSTVVTNESRFLELIREKAGERRSKVIIPKKLSPGLEGRLPFGVFPENISLALTVCELGGADYKEAGKAILESIEGHPSACKALKLDGKDINFLDAFSVNDVESTESYISYWKNHLGVRSSYSVLLNTRSDRPLRTEQLTGWISNKTDEIDRILISGSHSNRAAYKLKKSGYSKEEIVVLKKKDLDQLKGRIESLLPDKSLLIGVGNVGGQGHKILNALN